MTDSLGFAVAYTLIDNGRLKLWTSRTFTTRAQAAESIAAELAHWKPEAKEFYHLQVVELVATDDPAEAERAHLEGVREQLRGNAFGPGPVPFVPDLLPDDTAAGAFQRVLRAQRGTA